MTNSKQPLKRMTNRYLLTNNNDFQQLVCSHTTAYSSDYGHCCYNKLSVNLLYISWTCHLAHFRIWRITRRANGHIATWCFLHRTIICIRYDGVGRFRILTTMFCDSIRVSTWQSVWTLKLCKISLTTATLEISFSI